MKETSSKNIRVLIFYFICITVTIQLQSCYSIIRRNQTAYNSADNRNNNTLKACIIEGDIIYANGISTRGEERPRGFMLENFYWLENAPVCNVKYLFLDGAIDSSCINKKVMINGIYQTPPPSNADNIFSGQDIRLDVTGIKIIN